MNDFDSAGDKPRDRSTNGHTITGDGVVGASAAEIDWQQVRDEVGE